jgi:hypothetical protein
MSMIRKQGKKASPSKEAGRRVSKKDQIRSLFVEGITEVEDLALITNTRPSYVAGVLQGDELLHGYFDLYTTTDHPMNVYSKFFAKKLGFKDEGVARSSVGLIDHLYRQFELAGDRSGQHHALLMALMMFNRARWTGKAREADIFRQWLLGRLQEAELAGDEPEGAKEESPPAWGRKKA